MSGGHYSVGRFVFGLLLLSFLVPLFIYGLRAPPDLAARLVAAPANPTFEALCSWLGHGAAIGMLTCGVIACCALIVGWLDGAAAVVLIVLLGLIGLGLPAPVWSVVVVRLSVVVALLAFHATTQRAPYWSLAATRRTDPHGGWTFGPRQVTAAWGLLGLGLLGAAYVNHESSFAPSWVPWVQLGAAVLLLIRAWRKYVWTGLLIFHLGWIAVAGGDVSHHVLLLHWITFDPAWIPPRREGIHQVFFDANCGLCHASTRFLLAEDPHGAAFRFAPLDGETYQQLLPTAFPDGRPDSVVVLSESGRAYTQYKAVLRLGSALGGLWGALAWVGRLLPVPLRNPAYTLVAKTRRWFFPAPKACSPHVPRGLLQRFDP